MTTLSLFREIVRHELAGAFRTRRVWVICAFYLLSAMIAAHLTTLAIEKAAQTVVDAATETTGLSAEAVRLTLESQSDSVLDGFLEMIDINAETIAPALRSSALSVMFFLGSLWFVPWLVVLSTFDAVSSDLAGRTLCYNTMRAPRSALLAGRFTAHVVLLTGVTLLSAAAVLVPGAARLEQLTAAQTAASAARALAVLIPYTACYAAISIAASSATKRPMLSLMLSLLILLVLRVAGIWEDDPTHPLHGLHWISPSTYRPGLWSASALPLLTSIGAHLGFAALGLWIAVQSVSRRDL